MKIKDWEGTYEGELNVYGNAYGEGVFSTGEYVWRGIFLKNIAYGYRRLISKFLLITFCRLHISWTKRSANGRNEG